MSGKGLGKSFAYEEEAGEKEMRRKDPPEFVPWSNPNELQVTGRNTTQGPGTSGTRRVVSSARYQDTSPGAESLSVPGRNHPVFIEEKRPAPLVMPGIDHEEAYEDDGLAIEEENDDQVTVASHEDESTIHIIARAVDTEEERRMRHELEQLRQMQIRHERDQLRQMLDNAPILTPVIATKRDMENQNENVHANHDDLPGSDGPKCGSKGKRWFAMIAILLIVVAIAVTLALVLPPEPPPPPDPLSELLSNASSDGGVALADSSTPQNRAMEWLAGDPNLANYTVQEVIQRYALATLYYTTEGESWNNNDYWLSYQDVCGKWYSVNDDTTIYCTMAGAVSSLDLRDNNLQGVISPEIGMLSDELNYLWLAGNELEGPVPTEIGELTKLTSLSLWNNSLIGAIPSVIGRLTNLEVFYLYNNMLDGTLPTEMGDLTKLTSLALANNSIRGPIPSVIGLLTNLEGLWLNGNSLEGAITTELGLLTKLMTLELDHNSLTGTIPPFIGTFTDLDFLDFGFNILRGQIPTELGLLTKLTYLYLTSNGFTGTIPSELGLLTKLTYLGLSRNEFTRTVPTTLASLTLLNKLFLYGNDLTGSLLGFLCGNEFEYFAANTCGQDEIECECCTHCCDLQGSCFQV